MVNRGKRKGSTGRAGGPSRVTPRGTQIPPFPKRRDFRVSRMDRQPSAQAYPDEASVSRTGRAPKVMSDGSVTRAVPSACRQR